jgi:nucleoid-associated protein YgaU
MQASPISYEVLCYQCGRVAYITPDAIRCSHCQANLRTLIAPDAARVYFYQRAQAFADRGEAKYALAEAKRGIEFSDNSELRLLAAILARRLGNIDEVRRHVAAIAVDDRLREEAEWLLRSADSGFRPMAISRSSMARTPSGAHGAAPMLPPQAQTAAAATGRQAARPLFILFSVLALVVLLWNFARRTPQVVLNSVTPLPTATEIPLWATAALPTVTPQVTPSPASSEVIVNAAPLVDQLAARNPTVGLETSTVFNLAESLNAAQRNDLAALPVEGRLNKTGRLVLAGTVSRSIDRAALIEASRLISGVNDVDALGLLVRTPPTYTVQSGDTLWNIAYRFYGENPKRVAELFEANRDILPTANELRIGMEIKLPPNE